MIKKFTFLLLAATFILPIFTWAYGPLTSPIPIPITSTTITSLFDHDSPNYIDNHNFIRYNGQQWTDGSASLGPCTEGLNCYDGHNGIDFEVASGTPALAAAQGVLQSNYYDMCGGHTVRVWHPSLNYSTLYAHVSLYLVNTGSPVDRFEHIALSGNTGICTGGPHLHFGLRQGQTGGFNIDPYGWSGNSNSQVPNDPWPYNLGYLWTTNPPSLTPPTGSTLPVTSIIANITQNTTWVGNRVYLIIGQIDIDPGVTLTINSGAILKFQNSSNFMRVLGTLRAQGTSQDKIYFTSYADDSVGGDTNMDGNASTPAPSDYRGIVLTNTGTVNLNNVVIRYGGYWQCGWSSCAGPPGAIVNAGGNVNATSTLFSNNRVGINSAGGVVNLINSTVASSTDTSIDYTGSVNLTLAGSTITQNGGNGILANGISGTSLNLSVSNSTISENYYGLHILAGQNASSTISITDTNFINNRGADAVISGSGYPVPFSFINHGNTTSGNTKNGFRIGIEVSGNHVWNPGVPFIIDGPINIPLNSTLTINPGVVVKFDGSNASLRPTGSLNMNGTPQAPIYFTSYKDDTIGGDSNGDGNNSLPQAGDYSGMYIAGGPVNISNAEFRYGGGSYCGPWSCYSHGIIAHAGTIPLNISSSVFKNNEYGINVQNGATTTISGTTITDSRYYGVYANGSGGSLGLSISGSTISNNGHTGVYVIGQYSNQYVSVTDTNFGNNRDGDVSIQGYQTGFSFVNHGNTTSGNTKNGFYLYGDLIGHQVWNPGVPIIVNYRLVSSPNSTLTINPGTVVKFLPASYMQTSGNLVIDGQSNNKVYFTSYADDFVGGDSNGDGATSLPQARDYPGLVVSGLTNISNTVFRYGGAEHCPYWTCSTRGALTNSSSMPVNILSSTFSNNGYGIYLQSSATTTIRKTSITDNTYYGILATNTYSGLLSLSITESTIARSGNYGVYVGGQYGDHSISITDTNFANNQEGDGNFGGGYQTQIDFINSGNRTSGTSKNGFYLSGSAKENQIWNPGVPFIAGRFSTGTKSLTVKPGAIVKFQDEGSYIQVGGNFTAVGTPQNKIYFTSYKDDTVGGDSNGNGWSTLPIPSDYGGVFIGGNGNSRISNAIIRFGGRCIGQWSCVEKGAIMYRGQGNLTLDSNIISQNEYAIERRSGTVSMRNNAIFGNTGFGFFHTGTGSSTVATNNWWGDSRGPRHANNPLPIGLGDWVWGNVLFSPWLPFCNFEGCVTS